MNLNNVTYPWCISFTLHARKCPWPILERAQVPSFHVIIHCNSLKRIYPPCYWERGELTLGQIAPWTWSLYFEFLLLITSSDVYFPTIKPTHIKSSDPGAEKEPKTFYQIYYMFKRQRKERLHVQKSMNLQRSHLKLIKV